MGYHAKPLIFNCRMNQLQEIRSLLGQTKSDWFGLSNDWKLWSKHLSENLKQPMCDFKYFHRISRDIFPKIEKMGAVVKNKEFEEEIKKRIFRGLNTSELRAVSKSLDLKNTHLFFHAVKTEYVRDILDRGGILGYTTHRYWDDGRRYKDNEPEYNNSYWMKGISMTLSLSYALGWGHVVLVFDKNEIIKRHPIENYNWGHHIAQGSRNHKKEYEEFVVLSKTGKRYLNKDNPEFKEEMDYFLNLKESPDCTTEELAEIRARYDKKQNDICAGEFNTPEGEFVFGSALKGIIVRGSLIDIYGTEDALVQYLVNHPKFLGILEGPNDI